MPRRDRSSIVLSPNARIPLNRFVLSVIEMRGLTRVSLQLIGRKDCAPRTSEYDGVFYGAICAPKLQSPIIEWRKDVCAVAAWLLLVCIDFRKLDFFRKSAFRLNFGRTLVGALPDWLIRIVSKCLRWISFYRIRQRPVIRHANGAIEETSVESIDSVQTPGANRRRPLKAKDDRGRPDGPPFPVVPTWHGID